MGTREQARLEGLLAVQRATEIERADEAIEARYHTSVIALVALERDCVDPSAAPEHRSFREPRS